MRPAVERGDGFSLSTAGLSPGEYSFHCCPLRASRDRPARNPLTPAVGSLAWLPNASLLLPRLCKGSGLAQPTMRLLGTLLLLSGAATAGRAQDSTQLRRARAFHCVFEKTWRGIVEMSDQARAELPKYNIRELSFNEVDRATGFARLTRDRQAHAVDLIQTPTGIVFVERDTPDLTFIFTAQDKTGRFNAIYSRRTTLANGSIDRISVSGACRAVP